MRGLPRRPRRGHHSSRDTRPETTRSETTRPELPGTSERSVQHLPEVDTFTSPVVCICAVTSGFHLWAAWIHVWPRPRLVAPPCSVAATTTTATATAIAARRLLILMLVLALLLVLLLLLLVLLVRVLPRQ
jgi:hypothetical protein